MSGIQRQTVTAILIVTIGEELSTPKKKSPMESKGVRVMTDKERQEDEKLKKCLQTAYGATDEQLLKELEEAEASLDASEFPEPKSVCSGGSWKWRGKSGKRKICLRMRYRTI